MCDLNFSVPNRQKRGRSGHYREDLVPEYGPDPFVWFSWMDWNYHEKLRNVQEILEDLGFSVFYDDDGNLLVEGYNSKSGQEGLFLKSISTLSRGFILWEGEDKEQWVEFYGDDGVVILSLENRDRGVTLREKKL